MRDPSEIRESCAKKISQVELSDHFRAILGCLLEQDWTRPRLVQMVLSPYGHLLGRANGQATEQLYLGSEDDLTRNIHGLAAVAELDGDEVGYLAGALAAIKRKRKGVGTCQSIQLLKGR
ncbi:MAG: hypothetical protein KGS49_07905 [Planctomycetes bacterium]|nr:hypothetical protein [Planctomycetota bacterium]